MKKIFEYVKTFWYLPAFVAILGVYLWKKKKAKPKSLDASAQKILDETNGIAPRGKNLLRVIAQSLAVNLGTAFPAYDPRNWTENDEKVYEAVRGLNQEEFDLVSKLYFEVYAKGNTLSADLAKLLDAELYEQLTIK